MILEDRVRELLNGPIPLKDRLHAFFMKPLGFGSSDFFVTDIALSERDTFGAIGIATARDSDTIPLPGDAERVTADINEVKFQSNSSFPTNVVVRLYDRSSYVPVSPILQSRKPAHLAVVDEYAQLRDLLPLLQGAWMSSLRIKDGSVSISYALVAKDGKEYNNLLPSVVRSLELRKKASEIMRKNAESRDDHYKVVITPDIKTKFNIRIFNPDFTPHHGEKDDTLLSELARYTGRQAEVYAVMAQLIEKFPDLLVDEANRNIFFPEIRPSKTRTRIATAKEVEDLSSGFANQLKSRNPRDGSLTSFDALLTVFSQSVRNYFSSGQQPFTFIAPRYKY